MNATNATLPVGIFVSFRYWERDHEGNFGFNRYAGYVQQAYPNGKFIVDSKVFETLATRNFHVA